MSDLTPKVLAEILFGTLRTSVDYSIDAMDLLEKTAELAVDGGAGEELLVQLLQQIVCLDKAADRYLKQAGKLAYRLDGGFPDFSGSRTGWVEETREVYESTYARACSHFRKAGVSL